METEKCFAMRILSVVVSYNSLYRVQLTLYASCLTELSGMRIVDSRKKYVRVLVCLENFGRLAGYLFIIKQSACLEYNPVCLGNK